MQEIKKQINFLRNGLNRYSNSERAVQEKRYLKSPFKFFDVSLPLTDKIAKEFRKSNGNAGREHILELAQKLWNSEYHDEKRLGLRILQFIRKAIGWGIREMSKSDPEVAFQFLMKIKDRASGLTLREGAKRLPDKQREIVLK
jgi:hypothetical protein